jgi:hypothetical protein
LAALAFYGQRIGWVAGGEFERLQGARGGRSSAVSARRHTVTAHAILGLQRATGRRRVRNHDAEHRQGGLRDARLSSALKAAPTLPSGSRHQTR